MKNEMPTVMTQTPSGSTSYPDNLEAIAIMESLAIIVVLVAVGWWSCRQVFGSSRKPKKKMESADPTDRMSLFK